MLAYLTHNIHQKKHKAMKLLTSRKHRRLYRKLSCIYTGEMSGENISCLLREYDICCHTPEWASPNVWCCQSFQPTTVQMPTYFWETAASRVHCSYLNTKNTSLETKITNRWNELESWHSKSFLSPSCELYSRQGCYTSKLRANSSQRTKNDWKIEKRLCEYQSPLKAD
jgi:hypothetical protein